jgi:2-enoate reductase
MKPEVVFVATGSAPMIPDIPGIEETKAVTAVDLLLGKGETGGLVVVIGGGSIGCETALYLAQKGKKVTVVELLANVMRDLHKVNKMHLLELLSATNVEILTETSVLAITNEGVNIAKKCGDKSFLKADTIVLAVGMNPREGLFETIKDRVPRVYAIGDCVEPRKVINAIWEGFRLARLI